MNLRSSTPPRWLVIVGTVMILIAGCTSRAAPLSDAPPEAVDLVVLHTNDLWGEAEPCG